MIEPERRPYKPELTETEGLRMMRLSGGGLSRAWLHGDLMLKGRRPISASGWVSDGGKDGRGVSPHFFAQDTLEKNAGLTPRRLFGPKTP